MVRVAGRVVGWALMGLVGTAGIFAVMSLYVATQVPVSLRSGGTIFTDNWDSGFVHASGTWVIENDRQPSPLQFTELRCFRSDKECQSAARPGRFQLALRHDLVGAKRIRPDT
jgi:hypothetical protein